MILKDELHTTPQNEVSINPNALIELGKLAEQFPEIGIDNIRHIFVGRIKLLNIASDEIYLQKVGAGLHHIFGIKNGYGRIVPGSIQTHRYGIYSAELSIAEMVDGVVSYIPKCDSDINMIRTTFFPDSLTPFQILSEIQNALNAIKKYFVGDEPVTKLINLENASSIQEDLKNKGTRAFIYRLGTNYSEDVKGMPIKIIIDEKLERVISVYPIIFVKKQYDNK